MFIKILLKYILGYVRITVEGYYIERFINICTTSKILIWNLKREKGVRLYLNIGIKDFFEAVKMAKKLKFMKPKKSQKLKAICLAAMLLFQAQKKGLLLNVGTEQLESCVCKRQAESLLTQKVF